MLGDSPQRAQIEPRVVARTRDHLFAFLGELRREGLTAPVGKQRDFLAGIEAIAPSTTGQLYWTGAATLVTSRATQQMYDEVFRRFFGQADDALVLDDDEPNRPENDDDQDERQSITAEDSGPGDLLVDGGDGSGLQAGRTSPNTPKHFGRTTPHDLALMSQIRAELPGFIPRARSHRRQTGRRRQRVDLRAVYLQSRRTHGEIVQLRWRHRPSRPRQVLLLIDVSGSMKTHSPGYLRFAHALVATGLRAEVFTFGTTLTRVTSHVRCRDVDAGLDSLAQSVLDADGGTLIGESLQGFLSNTRYLTMARGALILVLSDGLERGDCTAMVDAVRRLSRLAHQLAWWSPLACDPAYEPRTRGMAAVLPYLDTLVGVRDLRTALAAVRNPFSDPLADHSMRRTCA